MYSICSYRTKSSNVTLTCLSPPSEINWVHVTSARLLHQVVTNLCIAHFWSLEIWLYWHTSTFISLNFKCTHRDQKIVHSTLWFLQ